MPGDVPQASALPLGERLRGLRKQRGRTIQQVTTDLSWSISKLSRIESGKIKIARPDLLRLLRMYGAEADDALLADSLISDGAVRPRRAVYALPDAYERFVRLEQQALRVCAFGMVLIPGLFQTPEYASAVINAYPAPGERFERPRIEARMLRQALLARIPAPRLEIVIDEAALRRPVGGASVMRRQMLRLVELGERPETEIRVLPFAVGAHPGMSGPFSILEFDYPNQNCVFCDGMTGGVLRSRPEELELYRICFEALMETALSPSASVEMLHAIAAG